MPHRCVPQALTNTVDVIWLATTRITKAFATFRRKPPQGQVAAVAALRIGGALVYRCAAGGCCSAPNFRHFPN